MGQNETKVSELCTEVDVTRQTLYRRVSPPESCDQTAQSYRYVSPVGELHHDGERLLSR